MRNLRVSRLGTLQAGSQVEPIAVEELSDAEKPALLQAYVQMAPPV